MTALWKNRIVGHDRVCPQDLLANPFNHRLHPPRQREALASAIAEVGFIRSVTVNRLTGNVIDGHERLWQALQSQQPYIEVEYVELSEDDERKALATFDRIGEMAEVDPVRLDELLRQFETGSAALQEMLAEMADEAGLYRSAGPADATPPATGIDESDRLADSYRILIVCDDESQQVRLLEELSRQGVDCRALMG